VDETFFEVKAESGQSSLWRDRPPLLGHLDLELTERCNNNCIHCSINLPDDSVIARGRELHTEEVKKVLAEAAGLGCLSVRFTGGEPLLREDFEDLYLFARRLGLRVFLFTNATLITPHLVELFLRIPPLKKMEISVYGMKRSSYEAVTRNPGSYEAAREGIRLLLEKKIPFVVKGALLPPNKHEIDEFESWALTIPWMDIPPGYSLFFDLRCRRDSEEKNRLIRRLRPSPEEGISFIARHPEQYLRSIQAFCGRSLGPHGEKLFSCGAGHAACVDAYGRCQSCMGLRSPAFTYDIRTGLLRNALVEFFPRMGEMKATHPDYLVRCARCFLRGLCEQCPAKSWAEHGTLDTPVDYLCEVAHAQARYLGLLRKSESAWRVTDWRDRTRGFASETEA